MMKYWTCLRIYKAPNKCRLSTFRQNSERSLAGYFRSIEQPFRWKGRAMRREVEVPVAIVQIKSPSTDKPNSPRKEIDFDEKHRNHIGLSR